MTTFGRWLPAITHTSVLGNNALVRKGALGLAGLAVVAGAIAGPATTAHAAPPQPDKPAAAVQQADQSNAVKNKNLRFSYQEQPNVYYCGPAATRIALSAHGNAPSQQQVAKKLGTTQAGTDSVNDVTRVLNQALGKRAYTTTEIPTPSAKTAQVQRLKTDLTNAIDHQRIPVVNVIGTATDTDGGNHSFPTGHYLTVVGYTANGNQVKIADPWQPVGDGTYTMTTTNLANWAATRGYTA
jgi:Peptidase_C39 like family